DLVDRIDAVAAAALGHVERVVEHGLAAEIVVLAGLVGRVANLRDRESVLVPLGIARRGVRVGAHHGGCAAAALGDRLHTGVAAEGIERRGGRARAAVTGIADHIVLPVVEDRAAAVVAAIGIYRRHGLRAVGADRDDRAIVGRGHRIGR